MKQINRKQLSQLKAILRKAKRTREQLDGLTELALQITDERDETGELELAGHTADAVLCAYPIERLLDSLEIVVEPSPEMPLPYPSQMVLSV